MKKEVLVKDIYAVDTISKGNSRAWQNLMDYINNNIGSNDTVEFDFKGIEVIQPWGTPEFKKLMQDPRVYLKIWNNADTVTSINIMCALNGFPDSRAENMVVTPVKKMTKEELKIIEMGKELQDYFTVDEDGNPHLNVHDRFDQIGVPATVNYIEAAMRMYAEEHQSSKMYLDAINIVIQTSVIKNVTNLIKKLADIGVELVINSNDTKVMNKVGMYRSLEESSVESEKDKIRVIKANLRPGKVGMLIRYKDSKATDEFGRRGNGEPLWCRVAIYTGIKREKNTIVLNFRVYKGDTFYTHVHWALEHDDSVLSCLECENVTIPVDQFGMYNDFLGSRYHLITPVQIKPEHSITMYGVDENERITHTSMTIPERIKTVFDDWGIKYDNESLQSYIQKTREILG